MIYQKAIVSYKEVMDYLRSKSNPTETELVSYIQSKFGYKPHEAKREAKTYRYIINMINTVSNYKHMITVIPHVATKEDVAKYKRKQYDYLF